MKKIHFSTQINASKSRIWQILWDEATYRQWTEAFQVGSYAESDWQEGSKVLFMDGHGAGIISRIAQKIPNELMNFEHLGSIKDGVEDYASAKTEGWAGSTETYALVDEHGGTTLNVTIDVNPEYEDYFTKTFPLAMEKVKSLAETPEKTAITIEALINVPEDKVWELWTQPEHIIQWNNASDDWHTTAATNDLQTGGRFSSIMAAKDGSFSFDFWGIYDKVKKHQTLAYTMGDGRKAETTFTKKGQTTLVTTVFEAETENSVELQQGGWQAILNNFKKYAETQDGEKKNN